MKRANFAILVVFCLSLFAIQCSQDSNPVGPGVSTQTQSGDAVLFGNFVTSGTSSVDFGLIQVSIRGTNIQAQPDPNGDFQINGLPTGNQSVEVNVENCLSFIDIADVQSGEEIRMQLEIQANNSVMLQNMERKKKSAETLQLEIQPKKWNIDWENSTDEVQAKIYGPGYETIDPNLIEICGPTGKIITNFTTEPPGGVYFKIFFSQQEAIGLIEKPQRGDSYEITVTVTPSTGTQVLPPYEVEIVGKKSDEEETVALVMDISPDKWNTNWAKSNGFVTVRFRGEGFDKIVPEFTSMTYKSGSAALISDGIYGSSYSAKFSKKEAIALFGDLQEDTYPVDVTVQLDDNGSTHTETYTISIVGSKK